MKAVHIYFGAANTIQNTLFHDLGCQPLDLSVNIEGILVARRLAFFSIYLHLATLETFFLVCRCHMPLDDNIYCHVYITLKCNATCFISWKQSDLGVDY